MSGAACAKVIICGEVHRATIETMLVQVNNGDVSPEFYEDMVKRIETSNKLLMESEFYNQD